MVANKIVNAANQITQIDFTMKKFVEPRPVQNFEPKIQLIRFAQIGFGPVGHHAQAAVELELNQDMFDVSMAQKILILTLVSMEMKICGSIRMKTQI